LKNKNQKKQFFLSQSPKHGDRQFKARNILFKPNLKGGTT